MITARYDFPENGFRPAEELEVGKEYELSDVSMGQSCTHLYLGEIGKWFNSVHFTILEDGKEINIFRDERFNPYL